MEQFDIQEVVDEGIAFVKRSGLKIITFEPKCVKVLMPLSGNENHVGTMYAGALFTLAEIPGGALFLSTFDHTRFYPVVKEMNIKYLKPATTDITFELTMDNAEVKRIRDEGESFGKCDFLLEGDLTNASGLIVGKSRGIYQMRKIGI